MCLDRRKHQLSLCELYVSIHKNLKWERTLFFQKMKATSASSYCFFAIASAAFALCLLFNHSLHSENSMMAAAYSLIMEPMYVDKHMKWLQLVGIHLLPHQ